jgi:hypothetical protein
MEFKHPKYYKELRKLRNKLDQAISKEATDGFETSVRSDPGLKLPGPRPISNANKGLIHRRQAASFKQQATSSQAASDKLQAPSSKLQAPSRKRQAP